MKKESKNLGISKACPSCRKTLIRDGNFEGKGTFSFKCPHCQEFVSIDINPTTTMKVRKRNIIIGLAVIFIIGLGSIGYTITNFVKAKTRLNCQSDFWSAEYDNDLRSPFDRANDAYKSGKKYLDKDKDGIPCENLLPTHINETNE